MEEARGGLRKRRRTPRERRAKPTPRERNEIVIDVYLEPLQLGNYSMAELYLKRINELQEIS